jgi:hypothetical protein
LTRFFNSLEEPTPEVASHLSLITSVLNQLHDVDDDTALTEKERALMLTIQALFRLFTQEQYRGQLASLVPRMIQKLPLSGEFLQSYADRDQLVRILATAIDRKRRLSNRDKYKYLRFLHEITAAP